MSLQSLNRIFLLVLTIGLSIDAGALNFIKKATSEKTKHKPNKKTQIDGVVVSRPVQTSPDSSPTKEKSKVDPEKRQKIIHGINGPRGIKENIKTIYEDQDFTDTKFKENVTRTEFRRSTLNRTKFYPPQLDNKVINWDAVKGINLDNVAINVIDIYRADMRDIQITNSSIDSSKFIETNMSSARLSSGDTLTKEEFISRNRAKIQSTIILNTEFINSNLNSLIIDDSLLNNVTINGGNIKHLIIRNSYIKELNFRDIENGGYVHIIDCVIGKITFDLVDFTFGKFDGNIFENGEDGGPQVTAELSDFLETTFGTHELASFFNNKGALVFPENKETRRAEIARERENRRLLKPKIVEETPEIQEIIEEHTFLEQTVAPLPQYPVTQSPPNVYPSSRPAQAMGSPYAPRNPQQNYNQNNTMSYGQGYMRNSPQQQAGFGYQESYVDQANSGYDQGFYQQSPYNSPHNSPQSAYQSRQGSPQAATAPVFQGYSPNQNPQYPCPYGKQPMPSGQPQLTAEQLFVEQQQASYQEFYN